MERTEAPGRPRSRDGTRHAALEAPCGAIRAYPFRSVPPRNLRRLLRSELPRVDFGLFDGSRRRCPRRHRREPHGDEDLASDLGLGDERDQSQPSGGAARAVESVDSEHSSEQLRPGLPAAFQRREVVAVARPGVPAVGARAIRDRQRGHDARSKSGMGCQHAGPPPTTGTARSSPNTRTSVPPTTGSSWPGSSASYLVRSQSAGSWTKTADSSRLVNSSCEIRNPPRPMKPLGPMSGR